MTLRSRDSKVLYLDLKTYSRTPHTSWLIQSKSRCESALPRFLVDRFAQTPPQKQPPSPSSSTFRSTHLYHRTQPAPRVHRPFPTQCLQSIPQLPPLFSWRYCDRGLVSPCAANIWVLPGGREETGGSAGSRNARVLRDGVQGGERF